MGYRDVHQVYQRAAAVIDRAPCLETHSSEDRHTDTYRSSNGVNASTRRWRRDFYLRSSSQHPSLQVRARQRSFAAMPDIIAAAETLVKEHMAK